MFCSKVTLSYKVDWHVRPLFILCIKTRVVESRAKSISHYKYTGIGTKDSLVWNPQARGKLIM